MCVCGGSCCTKLKLLQTLRLTQVSFVCCMFGRRTSAYNVIQTGQGERPSLPS